MPFPDRTRAFRQAWAGYIEGGQRHDRRRTPPGATRQGLKVHVCSCFVLYGSSMNPGRDWLYERLRSEPIRQDECARWNSIISRLSSLTSVDDSSMQAGLLESKA